MGKRKGSLRFYDVTCHFCKDGQFTRRGDAPSYQCSNCDQPLRCLVCNAKKGQTLRPKTPSGHPVADCDYCRTTYASGFWVQSATAKQDRAKQMESLDKICAYCGLSSNSDCPFCNPRRQKVPATKAKVLATKAADGKDCPQCEGGRLVPLIGRPSYGLICLVCGREFPPAADDDVEGSNIILASGDLDHRFYDIPCPRCRTEHQTVRFQEDSLHCMSCEYSWCPSKELFQEKQSTTAVIGGNLPKSNMPSNVACPACKKGIPLKDAKVWIECSDCREYFIPKTVATLSALAEAATTGQQERLSRLMQLSDEEIERALRFQEEADELEDVLSDIQDHARDLKDALYTGEHAEETFVEFDDRVERLGELHSKIMEGDDYSVSWSTDEDEGNRWSDFEREQKHIAGRKLGEDYHEVTIEEKGGDLVDDEVTSSAMPLPSVRGGEADDDYEYNDDDAPYDMPGFCVECGNQLQDDGFCLSCRRFPRQDRHRVFSGFQCKCGGCEFDINDVCLSCGRTLRPPSLLESS